MANKFDRDNYPTQEPDVLVIGDRWMWRRPDLASIFILLKWLQQRQQHIQQTHICIMYS
jgi:hypothetical protein